GVAGVLGAAAVLGVAGVLGAPASGRAAPVGTDGVDGRSPPHAKRRVDMIVRRKTVRMRAR
ncbi:MAG: hypothetical protein JWO86_7323, partial [Myxococcaceae bacterium]|nr:hypothetical protein [Myxococcaceae bacterium]